MYYCLRIRITTEEKGLVSFCSYRNMYFIFSVCESYNLGKTHHISDKCGQCDRQHCHLASAEKIIVSRRLVHIFHSVPYPDTKGHHEGEAAHNIVSHTVGNLLRHYESLVFAYVENLDCWDNRMKNIDIKILLKKKQNNNNKKQTNKQTNKNKTKQNKKK